jgi:hypothetical protein
MAGNGFIKPFLPSSIFVCPSSVQTRTHHRVQPSRLDSLLALVQMAVRPEEQRAPVRVDEPLAGNRGIEPGESHE